MLDVIKSLWDQCIMLVPCHTDPKNKSARVPYAHWRENLPFSTPSESEYMAIWAKYAHEKSALLLCEGVEVVDIDVKNALPGTNMCAEFEMKLLFENSELLDKLYIEESPSGGRHYMYRVYNTDGRSFAIARRPATVAERIEKPLEKVKTLIDFLAHGKLCKIAPAPGYKVIQGDITKMAFVTDVERQILVDLAASFNTYVDEPLAPNIQYNAPQHQSGQDERPGDHYNANVPIADVVSMCERHGYRVLNQQGPWIRLNRPGARHKLGVDASINANERYFYPFSASLPFNSEKAMSFFSLYAQLEHNGDFKAAAKALAPPSERQLLKPPHDASFFNASPQNQSEASAHETKSDDPRTARLAMLQKNKFSFTKEVTAKWMLYHKSAGDQYGKYVPLAGQGMIGVVTGRSKSFKSQIVGAIESSSLGREHELGFRMIMPEERPEILHIDTEQSEIYADGSVRRINWMANVNQDLPHYSAYFFREYSPAQRRQYLMDLVVTNSRIGLVVIDGLLDMVKNFNDEAEAAEFIQFLMALSDMGIFILCVIHTGEAKTGDPKPIGHLGSTIMRKADFILTCTLENPEEDDMRYTRVAVSHTISRGERIKSFIIQSYHKMPYLFGAGVPVHYMDHYEAHTGFREPDPDLKAHEKVRSLIKENGCSATGINDEAAVGNILEEAAATKWPRSEPDDFVMPTSGRAAAIAIEKDDDDWMALLDITEEELQCT